MSRASREWQREAARKRLFDEYVGMKAGTSRYTHVDRDGMPWRFEGGRPISMLGDDMMDYLAVLAGDLTEVERPGKKKRGPRKP